MISNLSLYLRVEALSLGMGCLSLSVWAQPAPPFVNFETAPVHPVALSPDGQRLAVCNLPDGRLELFNLTSGTPTPNGCIPVGLDPVTVRFRSNNEAWVVNHISSSLSVVDLSAGRVQATVTTRTGPSDLVFAGDPERAYLSCAGANTVQVFDPDTCAVITNIVIAGERPKAMAVSGDGTRVYVAVFESGNQTTILAPPFTIEFPEPGPLGDTHGPYQGQNPPPNAGASFDPPINPAISKPPPLVSHIVRKNAAGRWLDDNGQDWTQYVSGTNAHLSGRVEGWDLPDHDLAVIDTRTSQLSYIGGLMNICMSVAVNPANGMIAVVGTDATNERRFEPNLRSTFLRVNLALVDPVSGTASVHDLNPHLDYGERTIPVAQRDLSLGDPRGVVWNSSGTLGYVAGMGSRNVVLIGGDGSRARLEPIELEEGPCGLAWDEPRNRLYVLNRFSASLSVVDTTTQIVLTHLPLFDPTPEAIRAGRRHLYDTRAHSGLGHVSCASCHVDARMDRLAWDLGDPGGKFLTITNYTIGLNIPIEFDYHPMKGPMVTQTFQDIIGHEPFHWRGDRDMIEKFNPTFTDLLGRDTELAPEEMSQFKELLKTIHFPPNPFRNLDDTLPDSVPLPGFYGVEEPDQPLISGDPRRGFDMFFFTSGGDNQCRSCHERPTGLGSDGSFRPGPNGEAHIQIIADERTARLPFKIPQLRNIQDKIGLDYDRTNSRAGFGFTHDGRMDTVSKFLFFGSTDPVRYFRAADPTDFSEELDVDRNIADLTAFLLCFSGRTPTLLGDPFESGVDSLVVATAAGRQFTTTSNTAPLLDLFLGLADSASNHLDLVVRGEQDGQARGWYYAGSFISDRAGEDLPVASLLTLASSSNPLTFTLVPRGLGRRIGIDRDNDGWPDRTELEAGTDPADADSHGPGLPPRLTLASPYLSAHDGMRLALTPAVDDPDTPREELVMELLPALPPGASFDNVTGAFEWTLPPTLTERSVRRFYMRVRETTWPFHSDIQALTIESAPLNLRLGTKDSQGRYRIQWQMIPGRRYLLQYSTNLMEDAWINWWRTNTAFLLNFERTEVESPHGAPQKYFRMRLDP